MYLEVPLDPINLVRDPRSLLRWASRRQAMENLTVLRPATPIPIRDYLPLRTVAAHELSYRLCIPSIKRLVSAHGSPDVIWTTRPGSSVLKEMFPKAKLVFHVVDYYPAFRGDYVKEIERMDYDRSDLVLTVGHALREYICDELRVDSVKVHTLGQGVEIERYGTDIQEPDDLRYLPHPRAIYVGVVGKVDVALMTVAAQEMEKRGGSLILVGPFSEVVSEILKSSKSAHYLGPREYSSVPAYLVHSDIGLMLYSRDRPTVYFGQNPLKLYEYAAANLSIIATYHHEFDYIEAPCCIVKDESSLREAIEAATHAKSDLPRRFAEQNSWSARVQDAVTYIGNLQEGS